MKVRDLMTTDPLTATPEMLLKEAARLMVRNKVSGLPVISDGELVGIVTEGDFLRQEANRDQPYRFSLLDALFAHFRDLRSNENGRRAIERRFGKKALGHLERVIANLDATGQAR